MSYLYLLRSFAVWPQAADKHQLNARLDEEWHQQLQVALPQVKPCAAATAL
jgi:hypothetical protein